MIFIFCISVCIQKGSSFVAKWGIQITIETQKENGKFGNENENESGGESESEDEEQGKDMVRILDTAILSLNICTSLFAMLS